METADPPLGLGTRANYADIVSRIIVLGIGALRLREATTLRLDTWLIAQRSERRAQAELARTLLNQAFNWAAQRGGVTGNPVSAVSKARKKQPEPRALTVTELAARRDAVRNMRQNTWLADIFEVQLGVAGRIGEVLALTVSNLDLDRVDGARVRLDATVITPNGQRPSIQAHTKDGQDGRRTAIVSDWATGVLRKRALCAGESGLLFTSRNGTFLIPHNVRESWRHVRDEAGLGWVKPHHLRKTALSRIAEVFGLDAASKFAGHKTTAITDRHYIEKTETVGPDVRAAFAALAPKSHLTLIENIS